MEDNGNRFNIVIVLLCATLVFLISTWIFPNVNLTRKVTFETTALTFDAVEVKINWTAKYVAPIILPREIKTQIKDKIHLYGDLRIHALVNTTFAKILQDSDLNEVQEMFNSTDRIRHIIRLFDKKIDNIKSIKLNSIMLEKVFENVKEDNKINLITSTSWKQQ